MASLRTLLVGLLGVVTLVAHLPAQEPLDSIGPIEKRANPISPENPIPRRTFSVPAVFPAEARGINGSATVMLVATIDESGRVVEIRKAREPLVISPSGATPTAVRVAAEGFVREAASALRRWQYDPPAKGPLSFSVAFAFKPDGETQSTQLATAVPPPSAGAAGSAGTALAPPRPVDGVQPVRVGGQIKAPTLVKQVPPVYPPLAQSARVQGVVIAEAVIDGAGRVVDVRILRSVPLLDQAALEAVKQWEYTPTLLNGVPTPIVMTVTVSFNLASQAQAAQ